MDVTFYWWHWANHRIKVLWRFHNVHHVDPDLDVSTSFRFHMGEIMYSSVFRAVQVGLIGITPVIYIIYEFIFTCATMFHHSNLKLPVTFERILNAVFVTPRMHGIHHSDRRAETNSNYSVIFSWWDRLHGTINLHVPQSKIRIGVPGYRDESDNTIKKLLIMPFVRQKPYWIESGGNTIQREKSKGILGGSLQK